MLLCGDSDSLLSILISPIHPESQILPSSPPGRHNSCRWRPISQGKHRPSFIHLLWVIPVVVLCLFVWVWGQKVESWYLRIYNPPRISNLSAITLIIVTVAWLNQRSDSLVAFPNRLLLLCDRLSCDSEKQSQSDNTVYTLHNSIECDMQRTIYLFQHNILTISF